MAVNATSSGKMEELALLAFRFAFEFVNIAWPTSFAFFHIKVEPLILLAVANSLIEGVITLTILDSSTVVHWFSVISA
jgi:hypothetical protein